VTDYIRMKEEYHHIMLVTLVALMWEEHIEQEADTAFTFTNVGCICGVGLDH